MTASLLGQSGRIAQEGSAAAAGGSLLASPLLWASVLFALGVWLSLPRGTHRGRNVGLLLTVAALGTFGWQLSALPGWVDRSLFTGLASVTVLACVAAVISRNPVYSAIWFGLALLGTAGLFLLQGAQFLSVATITVYAGAILVTFLFVIMLAQPRGHAHYDRISWEAFLSAAAGAVLVGLLTGTIQRSFEPLVGVPPASASPAPALAAPAPALAAPAEAIGRGEHSVLAEHHVAQLGRELLGRHLISLQVAGALMLAALVGAVAIIAHGRQSGAASIELAGGRMVRPQSDTAVELPPTEPRTAPQKTPGGIHA